MYSRYLGLLSHVSAALVNRSNPSRQRGYTHSISQLWNTWRKVLKFQPTYVENKIQPGRQDRTAARSLRHVLVQSVLFAGVASVTQKYSRLWAQKGATKAFQISEAWYIHLTLCYQIYSIARSLQLSSLCWCLPEARRAFSASFPVLLLISSWMGV